MIRTLFAICLILFNSFVQAQGSNMYVCPGSIQSINSGLGGSSFRWELNTGNGFELLTNSSSYTGATTANLLINNISSSMNGYTFRCIGDTARTGLFSLIVQNNWIGGYGPFWENASNWSCGMVPDSTTDVSILSGNITIQNNIKVKSLHVSEDAKISLAPGVELYIAGQSGVLEPFSLLTEELDLLDSIGSENPPLSEIQSYTPAQQGMIQNSVTAKLESFIKAMLSFSWELSEAKKIEIPDEGDITVGGVMIKRPAHWGFAYSYGSRDYSERKPSTKGDILHNEYAVFGLDCSGFIYQIMNYADLKVSGNISTGNLFEEIQEALEETADFTGIKIVNKGNLEESELKNGDIILWAGHTGIFYNSDSKGPLVYQSNGTGTPLTKDACKVYNYETKTKVDGTTYKVKTTCKTLYTQTELDQLTLADQLKNHGKGRGVHPIKFTEATNAKKGYWGVNYKVLRFEPFEVTTSPAPTTGGMQTLSEQITDTTATLGGEVISDGGSSLMSRGICYSTNIQKKPTVFNLIKKEGNQLGTFTTVINKLLPGTRYAARAYAINQTDTAYGETIVFKTDGTMDTVAMLILHGEWRSGEGNFGEVTLGKIQYSYDWECPQPNLAEQTDSFNIAFLQNSSSYYKWYEWYVNYMVDEGCTNHGISPGEEDHQFGWDPYGDPEDPYLVLNWYYEAADRLIRIEATEKTENPPPAQVFFYLQITSFTPSEMTADFVGKDAEGNLVKGGSLKFR